MTPPSCSPDQWAAEEFIVNSKLDLGSEFQVTARFKKAVKNTDFSQRTRV